MAKGTGPIIYRYEVDGHNVAIVRRHTHTAYARNGNVGNPTEYFTWDVNVDGERLYSGVWSRAEAYEEARAYLLGIDRFNIPDYVTGPARARVRHVRPYPVVAREMKANYRSSSRPKADK